MPKKPRREKFNPRFIRVMRNLGGISGVCAITRRSPQSVCNWRARGFFPAVLADVIRYELQQRGCDPAPPELFRLEKVASDANAA
jgi:hypothetical protein